MRLKNYQERVELGINESIYLMGPKSPLRDACEYALRNGGKRFRPSIVLMVADAIGKGANAIQAALSIEYLHTASLIADDLPCMDDDDERRGCPSLHKKFNEPIALLASYTLISEGYGAIAKNGQVITKSGLGFAGEADRRSVLALENVVYNTSLLGVVGGQFADLYPPDLSLNTILEIIHQKTGTLFEASFVLGWLFGGGAIERLPQVKALARHFGIAFQIADDIDDKEQDLKNERKVNVPNLFGLDKALDLLKEHAESYQIILKELHIDSEPLMSLVTPLYECACIKPSAV
jgi:geranylgeranyl diphosphate synthase type II